MNKKHDKDFLDTKIVGSQKFWVKNKLWVKINFLGHKKNIVVPKNLGSEKKIQPEKNFGLENNQSLKKFWVNKKF